MPAVEASLRVGIRGGGCSGFSYVIEFHDGPPHARDRVFEHTASDAVISGGTTLLQRKTSPRSTMNASPTTEVSPNKI